MYNSTMMGYTVNSCCKAIDISFDNKLLLIGFGNREGVKIININRHADYWFQQKMVVAKIKNQTNFSVTDLKWNNTMEACDRYAMSTLNKNLYIYRADNPKCDEFTQCFSDSYIKCIQWATNSRNVVFATSQGNTLIAQWDYRQKSKTIQTINTDSETTQIIDFAFNPLNEHYYAVLYDDNTFSIFDVRNIKKQIWKVQEEENHFSSGNDFIKLRWDPKNQNRIAVANQNQIKVWQINEDNLKRKFSQPEIRMSNFFWRKKSQFFFTVSSKLENKGKGFYNQQILQYDFSVPEGGEQFHSYLMSDFYDYQLGEWIIDRKQELLITCSKVNDSQMIKKFGKDCHIILAQELSNFVEPCPMNKNIKPVLFDFDNGLVTTINSSNRKKSKKESYLVHIKEREKMAVKIKEKEFQKLEEKISGRRSLPSPKYIFNYRQEVKFLQKYYLIKGSIEKIIERNKQVAKCFQSESKNMFCAPIWESIFSFAFSSPQQHSLDSLFEDKIPVQLVFEDNQVFIEDKEKLSTKTPPINIQKKIQFLADQNELQTAIVIALILRAQKPELVSEAFLKDLLSPFDQVLRALQLYELADKIVLSTNLNSITKNFEDDTEFKIKCGKCRKKFSNCICFEKCILCSKPLKEGYLMWCKICGHAGHAQEYEEWFRTNKHCPYGCTHECFAVDD